MTTEQLEIRDSRLELLQQHPIDGRAVKKLAIAALKWLEANKQTINALNVFPVPDGDTGTNMVLTMKSALDEIEDSDEKSAGKMLEALAQGALMGARGNSGVILSQLWRGFARALEDKEVIDAQSAADGFRSAAETAYKGVVKPVEGTILTVINDMAAATKELPKKGASTVEVLQAALDAAAASVERTPDLLPILKEAGVVDSGGKGLFFIIEGMLRWIYGMQIHTAESVVQPISALDLEEAMHSVEEGQDFEVVIDFRPNGSLNLDAYYERLETMGTSIQMGEGDGMYRMHIHVPTDKRYEPIDYTMTLGTVTNVAIENLMDQMDEIEEHAGKLNLAVVQPEHIAVVAVAPGPGIARHFAELGVAAIVKGGQTMNPSTKDILSAFEHLPTDKIIILPNNKNIILAAEAAAENTKKQAAVVPTTSAPQGLAALLRLIPDGDFEQVVAEMKEASKEVITGEVTTATRDVEIDGVKVKKGQIIGLQNSKLVTSAANIKKGCMDLLKAAKAKDYELITIFYGEAVAQEEAEEMATHIHKAYPEQEIQVLHGGQPYYQYIFSIE